MQARKIQLSFGGHTVRPPVLAAPIAGYTDRVYRLVLREFGCPYCYTEMISARGLVMGSDNSRELLLHSPSDNPLALQLFGEDPEIMARAALLALEPCFGGFEAIDINMGCPARKITSQGAGGALLRDIDRAQDIIRAVKSVCNLPVTVKMRLGWDSSERAVEIAQALCQAGADMLAVHGRTVIQGYSGCADWAAIQQIAANVPVPVVGNGDIGSPREALQRLESTSCAGVMVGRAILGNPFFFRELAMLLETGSSCPATPEEKFAVAADHLRRAIQAYGERRGMLEMRKHLAYYVKGQRGAPRLREFIMRESDPEKVLEFLVRGQVQSE